MLVCAAASLAGCSRQAEPGAVTVVDSAGITLTLSVDVATTYAALSADPVVSLGGANAEGPAQFFRVTNVHLDRSGRIWVSDWQSGEVRVFDRDGAHLVTQGGRGRGPGEFTAVRLLGSARDGYVRAADQADGRLAIYGAAGELRQVGRLAAGDGPYPRPFDVYPDGSILGQVPVVLPSGALEPGQLIAAQVRLMRFFEDEDPRPLVDGLEGPTWLWTGEDLVPVPFTANAAFALRGDSLHLATGSSFRVRVYERDRVVRVYGVDRDEQPVTARDVEAYRETAEEAYPEERLPAVLSALDHPEVPSVLPGYTRLLVADDGAVWAGRSSAEMPWDVYAADGGLLGRVVVPPDFYPMSIRADRVAGVWTDDLGVEYVRVYAVARS